MKAVFNLARFLLDTKPALVVGVNRSNRRDDFARRASYGHCSSRNLTYFGDKLAAITTFSGIPVIYEVLPAHTGRNLEGLMVKTLVGLGTRMMVKMASHELKHVLDPQFGIKVQTFEIAAPAAQFTSDLICYIEE